MYGKGVYPPRVPYKQSRSEYYRLQRIKQRDAHVKAARSMKGRTLVSYDPKDGMWKGQFRIPLERNPDFSTKYKVAPKDLKYMEMQGAFREKSA